MDAVIEGLIQKDHVWLVFHLEHCPYWRALQQELSAGQQQVIGVCIDSPTDDTAACKTALTRLTGLTTTPCVYYKGKFVGDSQAAIALLRSLSAPPRNERHLQSAWLRTPERRWR